MSITHDELLIEFSDDDADIARHTASVLDTKRDLIELITNNTRHKRLIVLIEINRD